MEKKVFKKLNPDTIGTALFEIRFNLAIREAELFGRLYPILISDYPKLEERNHPFPREMRILDPNLKYLVNYTFSNETFAVSFGANSLVFEYMSDYKGWNHFSSCIKKILTKIDNLDIFKSVTRIGLRYINIVEEKEELNEVLDFDLKVGLSSTYTEKNIVYRTELFSDDLRIVLNIASKGKFGKKGIKEKEGVLIDIDVIKEDDSMKLDTSLIPILAKLHDHEKLVFTNILKQEFIDSLKPEY